MKTGRKTKNHPQLRVVSFCVGENLFSRAVTSQVSSAPASLTSVFGMGTGGPSRQSTPTCVCCLSRQLSYNTTLFQKMQAPICIFLKIFLREQKNHKCGPRAVLSHQTGERSPLRDLSSPGHRACAACPARVTGHRAQKNHPHLRVVSFCVGENLFFRAVTSQVSSAPASLTSVFGMGTGGPSRQSTPTCVCCLTGQLNYNTTLFQKMQAPICNF